MVFRPPRKVDAGLFLSLLLILGAIWKGYALPASWCQAVKDIEYLKPKVEAQGLQIAEIGTALNDMKDDVKFIRRHMRP